jgi:hypothetical protein
MCVCVYVCLSVCACVCIRVCVHIMYACKYVQTVEISSQILSCKLWLKYKCWQQERGAQRQNRGAKYENHLNPLRQHGEGRSLCLGDI